MMTEDRDEVRGGRQRREDKDGRNEKKQ